VTGPLYLAWRYLAHHRLKTAILVASIALIAFLPLGLNVLVDESARQLTARAEATPLLLGAKGSPLELTLDSLYFGDEAPEPISWNELERVAATALADPIPLYTRFESGGHAIVGTSLAYFDFRNLSLATGRPMAVLGECVVGAEAAVRLGVGPGDSLLSSPESVFDLAGAYPLKMHVTGVLAPTHGPDDRAIFVDVKTAWVMAGLGHGHQDLARPEAAAAVLSREGQRIVANASVREFNEITPENVDSFHFHGERSQFPLTAVIPVPRDEKARVLLMGRYESPEERVQIVRPGVVIDELMATVLTIRSYVVAAVGLVSIGTLASAALVFLLSLRLRRQEVETLRKIGASRGSLATLLASEVVGVLLLAGLLAAALTLLTHEFGSGAIRSLLVST
jgi:putative ABC transport system permease protein